MSAFGWTDFNKSAVDVAGKGANGGGLSTNFAVKCGTC